MIGEVGDTCGNPSNAIPCFWMAPSLSVPWLGLHRSLLDVRCTHTSPLGVGRVINSKGRDSTQVSLSSVAQKLKHYAWAISEATTWEQPTSYGPLQNVSFCTNHPWQHLSSLPECLTRLMKQGGVWGIHSFGEPAVILLPSWQLVFFALSLSTSVLSVPLLSWMSSAWSSTTSAGLGTLSLPPFQCHELPVPQAGVTITIVSRGEPDPPHSPAAGELTR